MLSVPAAERHRSTVLTQLRQDYQRLTAAWREHARTRTAEDASAGRQLMQRALAEWRVLAALEQEVLLPATRDALGPELVARTEDAYKALHALIEPLQHGTPEGDEASAHFLRLGARLQQHIATAEAEVFPRLEQADLDWAALADAMAQRRKELAAQQDKPDAGGLDDARPKHPEPERESAASRRERPTTGITPSGAAGGRRMSD